MFHIMEKEMIRVRFPLDDSITFNNLLALAHLLCGASCYYGRTTALLDKAVNTSVHLVPSAVT